MSYTLHSLARTTPKTRAEIRALRESGVSQRELMRRYSVSKATIVTRRFINPDVSRSGLNRFLQCEGLGSLRALRAARAGEKEEKDAAARKKGFKEYAPGFIHVDIEYLPGMPDETSRRDLFVAIDRASRWASLRPRLSATTVVPCAASASW